MNAKQVLFILLIIQSGLLSAQTPFKEYLFENGSLENTYSPTIVSGTSDLTQTGSAATLVTDRFGNDSSAISLNGDYFNAGSGTSAQGNRRNISMSFWIKTNTDDVNAKRIIEQYKPKVGTWDPPTHGWRIYLINGLVKADVTPEYSPYSGGGMAAAPILAANSTTNLADGQWHHVVVTMNSVYNSGWGAHQNYFDYYVKIYIDGVLETTVGNRQRNSNGYDFFTSTAEMTIGNSYAANSPQFTEVIDDIQIYQSAIDADKVNWLYQFRDPGVIYVDKDATGDSTGSSWVNAFTSLEEAINYAQYEGDEIWMADGSYTFDQAGTTQSFVPAKGVTLYGGFNGTETALAQRDWKTNKTIITGDIAGDDSSNISALEITRWENANSVFNIANEEVIIDGVEIQGGASALSGTDQEQSGAAIYIQPTLSAFTLRNSVISNNTARYGAVAVKPSASNFELTLENVEFKNNAANWAGALSIHAVSSCDAILNINNCLFHHNTSMNMGSDGYFGSIGRLISNEYALLDIYVRNSTFADNQDIGTASTKHSAFVAAEHAATATTNVEIYNSIFYNNTNNTADATISEGNGTIASSIILKNNLFSDTLGAFSGFAASVNNVNSIHLDPVFTDSANYVLQATSPAINYGDNAYSTTEFDMVGQSRILDAIVDLGAYETKMDSNYAAFNEAICYGDSFVVNGVAYDSTGVFLDTIVGGAQGGVDSFMVLNLTVNPLPTFEIDATDTVVCNGSGITLSSNKTDLNFIWNNSVEHDSVFYPTTDAMYVVNATDSNTCVQTDSLFISVIAVNDYHVWIADSAFCDSGATQVFIANSDSNYNYYLRNENDAILAGPIAGTMDTLMFETGVVSDTTTFNVYAELPTVYAADSFALDFDGSNDKVNTGASVNDLGWNSNAFTFETMIYPRGTTYKRIFTNYPGSGTAPVGTFIIDTYNASYNNGRSLRLYAINPSGVLERLEVPNAMTLNEWNHLAFTFDNGVATFYINGEVVGTTTLTFTTYGSNTADLYLAEDVGGTNAEFFNGDLDEVRCWNVARSQEDIKRYMGAYLNGDEEGLQLYYSFESNPGTLSITDETGNGFNGTMISMNAAQDWVAGAYPRETAKGCDITMSEQVTLNIIPSQEMTITASNDSICVGDTVLLIGAGDTNLIWSTNVMNDSIYVAPSQTDTLSLSIQNGLCVAEDTIEIHVTERATFDLIASDSTFCNKGDFTIKTTGSEIGANYWLTKSDILYSDTVAGTGDSIDFFIESLNESAAFALNIQKGACSFQLDANLNITVNPLPNIVVGASALGICDGEPVVLAGQGGVSYTWNHQVQDGDTVSPLITTTYIVEGTDSNNCSNTDTVTIGVGSASDTTYASIEICEGDSILLEGEYQTASGVYFNTLVNQSGCDSVVVVDLTVNAVELATITQDGISLTTSTVADQYIWTRDADTIALASTQLTAVVQGHYVLHTVDSNQCSSVSDSVYIAENTSLVFVDSAASGANNGSSWNDAYVSLSTALNAVNNGDQVWVAKGTYYGSFVLNRNIEIYGGFEPGQYSVDQRNRFENPTIFSGDNNQNDHLGTTSDNSIHVVTITANDIVIDGCVIEAGRNPSYSTNFNVGAGIDYKNQSNAERFHLVNCEIRDNDGYTQGAGLSMDVRFANDLDVKIENCHFHGNHSRYAPSFIILGRSSANMTVNFVGNLVEGNYTENKTNTWYGFQSSAGGMMTVFENANMEFNIINSTFSGNVNDGTGTSSGDAILNVSKARYSNAMMKVTSINSIYYGNAKTKVFEYWKNGSSYMAIDTVIMSHNIVEETPGVGTSTFLQVEEEMTKNPLLTTAYKLANASPALDAGKTVGIESILPTNDIAGNERQLLGIDLGAFEMPIEDIQFNDTSVICASDSAMINGIYTNVAGVYSDTVFGARDTFYNHNLIVNSLPNVHALATNELICGTGTTVVYGAGASIYEWTNEMPDGISLSLEMTQTFTVIGTDSNGCSNIDSVTVEYSPSMSVSGNATTAHCDDNSGSVSINVTGGTLPYTYEWNNDASTATIDSLASGWYEVTITDSLNCVIEAELEVENTGIDPADVTISLDGAYLTCDLVGVEYAWYLDGVLLSETTQSISIQGHGEYYVIVDPNNCAIQSNSVNVYATGTEEFAQGFKLYPNPVTDFISIEVATMIKNVKVYNVNGALVEQIDGNQSRVDMSHLDAGMYWVMVTTVEEIYKEKVFVE